jgi:hypothetical protein
MIRPLKCCGGFNMLHAIQPRDPPIKNVIAILTGINHLNNGMRMLGHSSSHRNADSRLAVKCVVFSMSFIRALKML